MNNRIDKLEARALALVQRNTENLLEVPTDHGTVRMTPEQFNSAGGICELGLCWQNSSVTLKTARKLLDAVPSAIE